MRNASTGSPQAPRRDALSGLAVLVVDDEPEMRDVVAAVLEAYGARVEQASSGRTALERLRAADTDRWPALLICDIALGEQKNGYEVLRALRALEGERGVPVERRLPAIALTGLADMGSRIEAMLAGFQLHLAKPALPRDLVAAVAGLATRRQQTTGH